MKRALRDPGPGKRWLAFLRNHKEAIAAMDFFTVPTLTFSLLYCFFLVSHDRRSILHFNVTKHPTTQWIIQQLREAFPFDSAPRFLIFDRDAKYRLEVPVANCFLSIRPLRTSFESPWQNGIAERWGEAAAATCWTMSSRSMNTTLNGCCLSTSAIITKTARILALRNKHRLAECPPRLPVGSCLTHGLGVCTIATIGPPN